MDVSLIQAQANTSVAENLQRRLAFQSERLSAEEKADIREAAEAFESYFLQIMMREMRNTVPDNGLIPRSNAEQIFTDMLDQETAIETARAGGIGLADIIIRQMTMEYSTSVPRMGVPLRLAEIEENN